MFFAKKSIKESNNIAVDPTCIVILNVAKYLLLCSYKILHIQLLATLIENLFLMFSLRYGQDDKYRENSSSTPGGEVPRSGGGEEHGNVTASNALFIKNRPPYFFIITDFIIFITDNTLLYNNTNHKYQL